MDWTQEISLLIHSGAVIAAPMLWAALGGAFSERSGVINIGLEGMMLIGAFAGVAGSFVSGNPWVGLICGSICGGLLGLLHAWFSVYWKANQIVCGVGINIFALGITGFLMYEIFETRGNSPEVAKIPFIQGWDGIPVVSTLFFPLSWLHVLLLFVAGLTIYLFYFTRFGLRMRACGEAPSSVVSAGIRPSLYRYTAVVVSGVLAGLGGVQLALGDISQFSVGMTGGRGFIALAALICSGWRPGRLILICIFFGCFEALGQRLQPVYPQITPRFYLMLPFILALFVLILRPSSVRMPEALGKV